MADICTTTPPTGPGFWWAQPPEGKKIIVEIELVYSITSGENVLGFWRGSSTPYTLTEIGLCPVPWKWSPVAPPGAVAAAVEAERNAIVRVVERIANNPFVVPGMTETGQWEQWERCAAEIIAAIKARA